jgi:2-polyprenyl-6-methoxyphenol hydroxylase-like FAD-dependent oxidoreductase
VSGLVRERASGDTYRMRCAYLVGADGARSRVVEQAGLRVEGESGLGGVDRDAVDKPDLLDGPECGVSLAGTRRVLRLHCWVSWLRLAVRISSESPGAA